RAFLPTRSWSSPGWGRTATSGGAPPAMAVPSTVGSWSPLDWYWAVTPVAEEKPLRTAVKSFCSVPDHTAQTLTLPPMLCCDEPAARAGPPPSGALELPQAAIATTATAATNRREDIRRLHMPNPPTSGAPPPVPHAAGGARPTRGC